MPPRGRPAVVRPTRKRTTGEIIATIRALVGVLQRSARAIEQHTGVTNAQLFVLRQLAGAGTLSINELAALAMTQQSTVSTVVARLARRGLVRSARAPDDARRATVTLTAAGGILLRHAPKPPTGRLLDALATLSEKELNTLAVGLRALGSAMQLSSRHAPLLFEENRAETVLAPIRRRPRARRPR